jgi:hypothetical protein
VTDDEDLEAIRAADAVAAETWFKGPASFTALAARHRRTLLRWLSEARSDFVRVCNINAQLADVLAEERNGPTGAYAIIKAERDEWKRSNEHAIRICATMERDLKGRLATAEAKNAVLVAALDWALNWHIAPTVMKEGKLGWGHAPNEAICDALNQSRDRIMASPSFPRFDMPGVDDA